MCEFGKRKLQRNVIWCQIVDEEGGNSQVEGIFFFDVNKYFSGFSTSELMNDNQRDNQNHENLNPDSTFVLE